MKTLSMFQFKTLSMNYRTICKIHSEYKNILIHQMNKKQPTYPTEKK